MLVERGGKGAGRRRPGRVVGGRSWYCRLEGCHRFPRPARESVFWVRRGVEGACSMYFVSAAFVSVRAWRGGQAGMARRGAMPATRRPRT